MTAPIKKPGLKKKAQKVSSTGASSYQSKRSEDEEVIVVMPPDLSTPKGQIFRAATRLFSEHGFKMTSTRAIANEAGVRQVMLNYYFRSKEQLYIEVLRYEVTTLLGVIFGDDASRLPLEEILIGSPIRLMTVLHDNPQWAALLRQEIGSGGRHLRLALRNVSDDRPLGGNQYFANAYADAVRAGKAVDLPIEAVRECVLTIAYSSILLAPLVSMINERDIHDTDVWQEWTETIGTILRRGLLISPDEKSVRKAAK